jgi:uncharacterized protein YjbI with pentapeptide repeats
MRTVLSTQPVLSTLPACAALALCAAGWHWQWFDTGPVGLLLLALEGALLNVALLSLFLDVRNRLTARQQTIARIARELRHLAPWDGNEGVLRKAGLIRDLNALGTTPRDLRQAMLRGADLTGCDLRGADLRGADLSRANLQGVLLDGADLSDADLSQANLALASLAGVNGRGCTFEGAALTKANLAGAMLSRATLVHANLHGTDLRTATLERARFAEPDTGPFGPALHPSVDDWIRERLDARGYFSPAAPLGDAPPRPRKARAG